MSITNTPIPSIMALDAEGEKIKQTENQIGGDDEISTLLFTCGVLSSMEGWTKKLLKRTNAYTGWPFHLFKTSRWLQTKVPLWPGLSWPGQNGTFVLKSTGCFWTSEMAPSTEMRFILCRSCYAGPRQSQAEQISKSKKKFHQTTYNE